MQGDQVRCKFLEEDCSHQSGAASTMYSPPRFEPASCSPPWSNILTFESVYGFTEFGGPDRIFNDSIVRLFNWQNLGQFKLTENF